MRCCPVRSPRQCLQVEQFTDWQSPQRRMVSCMSQLRVSREASKATVSPATAGKMVVPQVAQRLLSCARRPP